MSRQASAPLTHQHGTHPLPSASADTEQEKTLQLPGSSRNLRSPRGLHVAVVLLWKQQQGLRNRARVEEPGAPRAALTHAGRGISQEPNASTSQRHDTRGHLPPPLTHATVDGHVYRTTWKRAAGGTFATGRSQ